MNFQEEEFQTVGSVDILRRVHLYVGCNGTDHCWRKYVVTCLNTNLLW